MSRLPRVSEDELKQLSMESQAALDVLGSAAFESAVMEVRSALLAQWEASRDRDERERIHAEITGLRALLAKLNQSVSRYRAAQLQNTQTSK